MEGPRDPRPGRLRLLAAGAEEAERLWSTRRNLFFKPAAGHGSKAAYRGEKITRRVWSEVLAGEALDARDVLRQALGNFEIVELDAQIAMAAADIRYRSRMKLMDAYILATAQVNGAILITRNSKDFPAAMPGIRIPYTL